MGFFSWLTQDTNKSIASSYSTRSTFPVTMSDNKGNKWTESNYEGYGVFNGKDFFDLVSEMNGFNGRDDAIKRTCRGDVHLSPNLTEDVNHVWVDEVPEDCPEQGFFYDDEDDDDDVECPDCDGSGECGDEECERCEGEGRVYRPDDIPPD